MEFKRIGQNIGVYENKQIVGFIEKGVRNYYFRPACVSTYPLYPADLITISDKLKELSSGN